MNGSLVLEPRHGTVQHALWRFALLANKDSLHPRDWKRFYQFVAFAHQRHVGWGADDLQRRLRALGFDSRHAKDLAAAYWHGRCSLYVQKARPFNQTHFAWMKDHGIPWT